MINGVINIYKEPGYTSHDVVAKLRGILHQKRIGHTGTLDPAAEGVLPVCLGSATKLVEDLTDHTKEYVCTMRLGLATDTDDTTGSVIAVYDGVLPSEEEIITTCCSFIGSYGQIPPMYAAIKQGGKKLYEIARAGETVERKARPVTIFELEIQKILPCREEKVLLCINEAEETAPRTEEKTCSMIDVTFRTAVSKGTYIRALCRDIGEKLGCGATMAGLIRTRSGEFTADNAVRLAQVEELAAKGEDVLLEHILPIEFFFRDDPRLKAKAEARKRLDNGNPLSMGDVECFGYSEEEAGSVSFCIYDDEDRFRAVYSYRKEDGMLYPEKIFPV